MTKDVTPREVALIVNAHSRRGKRLFEAAREGLVARGFTVSAAHAVRHPRYLGMVLNQLIADGHLLIAVGGGDGTLASAAGRMANKPVVMGLLPLGTANSFARSLNIEPELDAALDVIAQGDIAAVDVISIGDTHFLNSATIGVPARIAEDIPSGLKRVFGRFGYLGYGLVKFLRMQPFTAHFRIEGQADIVAQVLEIRIGSGPFVGGLRVIQGADPQSRDVVVQLVTGRYAAALAQVWARNLAGWRPARGSIREFRAAAFSLSCTPEQPISVDGETGTCTPVAVHVAAGALRICVPKGSNAASREAADTLVDGL